MNYELAKGLKDSGFPQRYLLGCEYWHLFHENHQEKSVLLTQVGEISPPLEHSPHDVYQPSLEELIEACGERFICLEKYDGCWMATGELSPLVNKVMNSDTPQNAVADLWLALNEKEA